MTHDEALAAAAALDVVARDLEQATFGLNERARSIWEQVDALRLSTRPQYPTPADLAALDVALEKLRAGEKASSHHGDSVADDSGLAWCDRCLTQDAFFVSLDVRAPYRSGRGGKLWSIEDHEVQEFIGQMQQRGCTVRKSWLHSDGVSVTFDFKTENRRWCLRCGHPYESQNGEWHPTCECAGDPPVDRVSEEWESWFARAQGLMHTEPAK